MQPDSIILNFLASLDAVGMNTGLNSRYLLVTPDSKPTFRKAKASSSIIYQALLEADYILGPVLGTGNTIIIKA